MRALLSQLPETTTLIARRRLAALLLAATCRAWCATPAEDCRRDLADLPGFLLENDAGGKDAQARQGAAHFETALAAADAQAAAVHSDDECLHVLQTYLQAWRRTHLSIQPIAAPSTGAPAAAPPDDDVDRMPALRMLSARTLLLTLRSFNGRTREPLVRLLESHRRELESHPDWIVDVRDNDGGEDSSYKPLLPWLLANGGVQVGARILATPVNVAAWEHVCETAAPGDAGCVKVVGAIVQRMKAAPSGSFVRMYEGEEIEFSAPAKPTLHLPQRVAILIDGQCGSSCEQFLLDARQSFSVKLLGRHTWGGLDVSNLRPHDLPSGKRRLNYATSRSLRIPDQPVDGIGVLPDLYLPRGQDANAAQDEVERTRRWLEGGTLAPLH